MFHESVRSWRLGVSHGSCTPFVGSVTGSTRRTEMRLYRIVPATMMAAALLIVGEATASANCEWCVYDPPIQVVTPGGHIVTVNNTIYLPPYERHLASHFTATATAVSNGHGLIPPTIRLPLASWLPSSTHV